MPLQIVLDAREIWQRLAKDAPEKQLSFQLEVHKKILEFFHVGDYYFFVFNAKKGDFDFVSPEVQKVLGYPPEEVDAALILSAIHPEDQPAVLNFENEVTRFFHTLPQEKVPNYKASYDFRIRKRNGDYIRLLNQIVIIDYDKTFSVLRAFGVHTDITHLKAEGLPTLSFIGLNGEPSYTNVPVKEVYTTSPTVLSKREKEILFHLFGGLSTKQISQRLFISEETVKTHRKNILRKTNTNNVAALLSSAIKNGWV